MRLYGLIGNPLGHSFSRDYFTEKFVKEGIEAKYHNYPIESLDKLGSVIENNPLLFGLNVTLPYKREIFRFLDYIDPVAKSIGAVNVVKIERVSGKQELKGYNTDILGFRKSLGMRIDNNIRKAIILGTGGSSLSVEWCLRDLSIDFTKASRSPGRGEIGYSEIDMNRLNDCQLIVNTTPVGMYPDIDSAPDIPYHYLTGEHTLFDLVYNPENTQFLIKGAEQGCKTIGGIKMLQIQAEEAWNIWNSGS